MNGTILVQDTPMFSTIFVTVCFVIYMLIIATSLLGNTMVCLVICLNRSLRSCPTMSFILSLACSDLLTAAFAMPFDAEALLHEGRWRHAEVLCIVWTTAYLLSVPASITTLLFLTIDRYKSLSDPLRRFRESKFLSLRWARVTVVAVWCYCLAFALLPVMGWRYNPSYLMGGSCIFNITPFYSALSTALHFILPLLIIAAVYIKIYRIAQNVQNCHALCNAASNNQLPEHVARHPTARDHRTYQRKLSSSRTIALIVFALFICWFPYSMTSFVFSLCEPCYHAVSQNLLGAFLILGYLNSALNPFIYSIRNKRFKESYRAMFLSTIRFVRGISFNRSAQSSHNSSISSQRHVSVMSLETSSVQLTSFSIPSGSR